MQIEEKIIRLCDHWWTELSHSKSSSIRPHAEELLRIMEWERFESVYIEHAACGLVGLAKDNKRVVFYFTMPGELETPSVMLERGLDFCETTLMLVGEAQLQGMDYVIITDLNRTYVYDVSTDGPFLLADSPQLFVRDVLPYIHKDAAMDGGLDKARREPVSFIARQLRTWCERWTLELSREPFATEAIANAVMDRMLILRFLYDHPICDASNWSYKSRFTHLITSAYEENAIAAKRILLEFMHDLASMWNFDIFKLDFATESFIFKSNSIIPMLQEVALLAKTKFYPSTILESFNYGDASEKARVRLVPESNEDRETWLGQLSETTLGETRMEIDVLDEGYRAIGHWFDRLIATATRLSMSDKFRTDFREYMERRPQIEAGGELDLFAWTESDGEDETTDAERHLDLIAVCAERCLYLWTATERQRRTAELVIHLHLIDQYYRSGTEFGRFPDLTSSFGERPALLESDKQWIYQSREDNEWGVI